ncbi:MAG TPA: serine protease, partial [Nocardioides sp.]|nr:serine protease [Nocardioides sp.]
DMGAGRIDVGNAIDVPLLLDETAANFAAMGNDPMTAVDLNIPSINAPMMPGRLVTTRTVTNTSGIPQVVIAEGEAPPGTTITVTPRRFALPAGRSQEMTITIESDAPTGAQVFGAVNLDASRADLDLHLPVAFHRTQGEVSLVQSCVPSTVAKGAETECTVTAANNSFEEQAVELDSTVPRPFVLTGVDGATQVNSRTVHDEATLAGIAPGVPALAPPGGFGYLDLEAFGVAPTAIGDEQILNFNVPSFVYAGQTWNRIGVDSNGYLIVGGGSSEDNNCCNLPGGPDPERPNNVLAPFWTDLDGTGAEGIRAQILTDGVGSWLVMQHDVNVFGTTDLRSFQVWIGINGTEDIAYEYAGTQAAPGGQDFLVGAENHLGQGEMEAVLPTDAGLRVDSSDLVPGDVVSYTFTARGTRVGTGDLVTEMRASLVPGVTIAKTPLQVVP